MPGSARSGDQAEAPVAATTVEDEGFEPPAWLVIVLALAGIGGVVALLVLGPRDQGGPAGRRPLVATAGPAAEVAAAPGARRRWPLRAMVAIGLGLALAPAIFQMFTRAPGGGRMIDDFAPYMTDAKIDSFSRDLDTIGAAPRRGGPRARGAGRRGRPVPDRRGASPTSWPAIDDDMSSMLGTMQDNIDDYDGVAALPPFALFPWFFVVPGLLVAGVAGWSLRRDRTGVADPRAPHRARRARRSVSSPHRRCSRCSPGRPAAPT